MYAVCSDAEMNNSRSFVFVKVDKQMLVAYLIMFWMCVVGCACVCVQIRVCIYAYKYVFQKSEKQNTWKDDLTILIGVIWSQIIPSPT